MIFKKEDLEFSSNIKNIIEKTIKNDKVTILKFLDLHKQEIIRYLVGNNAECKYLFYGGLENSEYKRCIFTKFDITNDMLNVIVFEVIYNKKYLKLTHQNVLGNLMSLGITRDSIGDIIVKDRVYFAVTKEISEYLIDNFKTLNTIPISLNSVDGKNIKVQEEYDLKIYIAASLRIDVILSVVYNVSRNISKEYILANKVKINHLLCDESTRIVKELDVISIRGKGRIKIFKILNKTNKDKIKIEIGKII